MKKHSQPQAFFTLGIAGIFLAGFFLLVTFGAATYRQAVEGQAQNNRMRVLLNYISTCVRANDHAGALTIEAEGRDGVAGPVLDIGDRDSGYALRIYQWEGKLMEDYAPADSPLRPQEAQALGETQVFQVVEEHGVPYIVTDEGQAPLRLHSGLTVRCGHEE